MNDLLSVSRELLESLVDDEPCRSDHHGGCQNHGYLDLEPGEKCPQAELKEILNAKADGLDVGDFVKSLVEALKDAHRDMDFFASFVPDEILHSHLIPAQKRIEDVLNAPVGRTDEGGSANSLVEYPCGFCNALDFEDAGNKCRGMNYCPGEDESRRVFNVSDDLPLTTNQKNL